MQASNAETPSLGPATSSLQDPLWGSMNRIALVAEMIGGALGVMLAIVRVDHPVSFLVGGVLFLVIGSAGWIDAQRAANEIHLQVSTITFEFPRSTLSRDVRDLVAVRRRFRFQRQRSGRWNPRPAYVFEFVDGTIVRVNAAMKDLGNVLTQLHQLNPALDTSKM